jgi:hypothetical protein
MITKRDNGTSTKSGPGRLSCDGIKKTRKPKSAPGDWIGQHTNPSSNARRKVKAKIGARQYLKQRKALAAAARG